MIVHCRAPIVAISLDISYFVVISVYLNISLQTVSELKCAGLVAQVSKTSVHEIEDIEKEVSRLEFVITDPTGTGEYILLETPSPPASEQAGSVESLVENTPSEQTELEQNESFKDCPDEEEEDYARVHLTFAISINTYAWSSESELNFEQFNL